MEGKTNPLTLWRTNYFYAAPFPIVTLAVWTKYPNPFAGHVLTADTLQQEVDEEGRLRTIRLFTKKGSLPSWLSPLVGERESFVLETSLVNPSSREMWITQRNLSWQKVLLVLEESYLREGEGPSSSTSTSTSKSFAPSKTLPFPEGSLKEGMNTISHSLNTEEDLEQHESQQSPQKMMGTTLSIKASFISNSSFHPIRYRIEAYGLDRFKSGSLNSFKGMEWVLRRLRDGKGTGGGGSGSEEGGV